MKKLFARFIGAVVLSVFPFGLHAALVTYTVTITNTPLPGAGTNLTVNGITRNWTNAASTTGIQTNSASVSASATNLFRSWSFFPQVGVTVYQSATNVVAFRGLDITLSQGGTWASVSSVSAPSTNTSALQLPFSAASASQLWTNLDLLSSNRGLSKIELDAGFGLHGRYLVATNYTLTTNDLYLGVDTRSNTNLILTLPSASNASNLLFLIKDEGGAGGTNTIKIYPASGDRIDTLLTNLVVSNNFGGVQLRSRGGTNWSILASGGGVTGGIASSGGGVPLTNTVWVAKNGSDSTGERGDPAKAFLTPNAAKTASLSGDTIFVMPGAYTATNLMKNGVNWHFFNGASVTNTSGSVGLFDDVAGAATTTITGDGDLWDSGNYIVIYVTNSGSVVKVKAKTIAGGNPAVDGGAGSLTVEAERIEGASDTGNTILIEDTGVTFTLNRSRVVNTWANANSRCLAFAAANTNTVIRDCVFISNTTATNSINGSTPSLRIYGSLMSNRT